MIRVNHPAYLKKQAEIAEKRQREDEQRAIDARTNPRSSNALPALPPQYTPSLREIAARREFEAPLRKQEEARRQEALRHEAEREHCRKLKEQSDKEARERWERERQRQREQAAKDAEAKRAADLKAAAEFEKQWEQDTIVEDLLQPFSVDECRRIIALVPAGMKNRLGYEFAINEFRKQEARRHEQEQQVIDDRDRRNRPWAYKGEYVNEVAIP
jgi:hypothetical protein